MYAVATFIIVAVVSLLFTRIAAGALIATGLPPEIARFQARSAFTGSGFTTTESENVVNHPVRRRIIATTMLVGNLGTPTLIVTVLLGLLAPGPGDTAERVLVTVLGLAVVVVAISSRPVTRWLTAIGRRYANRWLRQALGKPTDLLHLGDGYAVVELPLEDQPRTAPRSIRGLELALAPARVLGVRRVETDELRFVAGPPSDLTLRDGDRLVLLGRAGHLDDGQQRPDDGTA